MAKAKAEGISCKYCGAKTHSNNDICRKCDEKKRIMHGWHWEYNPKKTIKI